MKSGSITPCTLGRMKLCSIFGQTITSYTQVSIISTVVCFSQCYQYIAYYDTLYPKTADKQLHSRQTYSSTASRLSVSPLRAASTLDLRSG